VTFDEEFVMILGDWHHKSSMEIFEELYWILGA
jgi:hypothetical protein